MRKGTCPGSAAMILLVSAEVLGVPYSVTLRKDEFANAPAGAFTLTFTNVPAPTAGGTLRIRAQGDLDSAVEHLDVSVEGVQFGPLFNESPADDRFDNAGINDDAPANHSIPASSIAPFSLAEIQAWSADGNVAVTIVPTANVNDEGPGEFIEVTLAYDAQAGISACCFAASETCQNLSATDCANAGGVSAGDGTTCETYVCFPQGACCLPDGGCAGDALSPEECTALNGTFQGHGSTCTASDCSLQGACCTSGACSVESGDDCALAGGNYAGDNTTCGGDGDSDGVAEACDVCPGNVPGAAVDVDGCPILIFGDFDHDGDVDSGDFTAFAACASRDGMAHPAGCASRDHDGDGDADLADFGIFQRCYSSQDQAAQPACDD